MLFRAGRHDLTTEMRCYYTTLRRVSVRVENLLLETRSHWRNYSR
jgi:hypothetical protein